MELFGFLTDTQIKEAIREKEIIIHPYFEENLTPVGYNFSFSHFIVSLTKKNLVDFKEDKITGELYFYLKPNETVLALTKETVSVSKNVGGTFHSKVSLVAKGLGHVSTTLDPGWQGQLLIPLNNPTKEKIKVIVEEKCFNKIRYKTFLTLVFFRSTKNATKDAMDNKPARIDLLKGIIDIKDRSRKRENLVEAVRVISHFYYYNKLIDLGTNQMRINNCVAYIDQHDRLSDLLEEQYPAIKRAARELRKGKLLKYIGFWVGAVGLLVALIVMRIILKDQEVVRDITGILFPIIIPGFYYLFKINDKYL